MSTTRLKQVYGLRAYPSVQVDRICAARSCKSIDEQDDRHRSFLGDELRRFICILVAVVATLAFGMASGGSAHAQSYSDISFADVELPAINVVILAEAERYLGVEEAPGLANNPVVQNFLRSGSGLELNDSTPWCSGFVNFVVEEAGLSGTGSLVARDWLNWGVHSETPRPGDIVIFSRGDPSGWQGHVAIFIAFSGDDVIVLGGNQGDTVNYKAYPKSKVLGYRKAVFSD